MKHNLSLFITMLLLSTQVIGQVKVVSHISEKKINELGQFIEALREKNKGNYKESISALLKVIDSNPKNHAAYFELSQIMIETKEYSKATEYIEQAVTLDPDNEWYQALQVELYTNTGNINKASAVYEKILKKNPKNITKGMQYAYMLISKERYNKALEVINNLEKNGAWNESMPIQRHRIYLKLNDYNNAENELKKLIQYNPSDSRFQLALAEFYEHNEKPELAIKTYKNVLLLEPSNPQALMYMSAHYMKTGDTVGFLNISKSIISSQSIELDTKIGYLSYGLANYNKIDTSIKSMYFDLAQQLVESYPNSPKTNALLGDFYFIKDDNVNAAKYYRNSLKSQNNVFDVWQNLFAALYSTQSYTELADSTEAAAEYFPAQSVVHYYNGLANQNLKKYDKSEKSYRKAIRFSGDNERLQAQIYSSLGENYQKQKKYTEMDQAFEEAIKLEPHNPYFLNNYAYYLSLRKTELAKAKKMSRKSLDIEPDNPSFLDTYAWICFQLEDYQEALIYQEKAVSKIKDDRATLLDHMGDIYIKLGNETKAIEYWKKSKEAGNKSAVINRKISEKKYIESNE